MSIASDDTPARGGYAARNPHTLVTLLYTGHEVLVAFC
jgi:hypothetical protein